MSATATTVSGMVSALAPTIFVERELQNGSLHTAFGPAVATGDSYCVVHPEQKAHLDIVKVFRDRLLRETQALSQAKPWSEFCVGDPRPCDMATL